MQKPQQPAKCACQRAGNSRSSQENKMEVESANPPTIQNMRRGKEEESNQLATGTDYFVDAVANPLNAGPYDRRNITTNSSSQLGLRRHVPLQAKTGERSATVACA